MPGYIRADLGMTGYAQANPALPGHSDTWLEGYPDSLWHARKRDWTCFGLLEYLGSQGGFIKVCLTEYTRINSGMP
jgi:hypothetical protein